MYRLSIDSTVLERYRVGPLGPSLDVYLTRVQREGFSTLSIFGQLCAIKRFSLWLQRKHLAIQEIDEPTIERFLRRDKPVKHKGESSTLARLLAALRDINAVAEGVVEPTTQQRVADQYLQHLLRERGLSNATASNYLEFATQFLSCHWKNGSLDFSTLGASDVTGFVQKRAHKLSPVRTKMLVTALRSFLRYLRHQGLIATDLAACVPAVATWRFSTLPRFLPVGTIQRIIEGCDRSTPNGKRNYAILLLLARLGLRAGEVVALNLEDIDWEAGRMTVRGKGGRSG